MRSSFLFLALLAGAPDALAGFGDAKPMREPLPVREVERPLLLPRGWVEFGLSYQQKDAWGRWTADGEREAFENASWTYRTASLDIRYGIARRAELWWQVPVLHATLANAALDMRISDASLGDPRFGYRRLLTPLEWKHTFVSFEGWLKAPAGKEVPGTYIGGPLNVSGFVFTTGTPDVFLGASFRHNVNGNLAVGATAGYLRRFGGIVQYLVERENNQFVGRINPGDQLRAEVTAIAQAGPVAISGTPMVTRRFVTRTGTTARAPFASKNLRPVNGSDGLAVDLGVAATLNVTRGFDVVGRALLPLRGEDLQFFPIEDLHPTLGPTFGGSLEFRY